MFELIPWMICHNWEIDLCWTMAETIINVWLLNVKRDLMFEARRSHIDFGRDHKWKWSHQLEGTIASIRFHTGDYIDTRCYAIECLPKLCVFFEPLLFVNKTKRASHSMKSRKNSIFMHRVPHFIRYFRYPKSIQVFSNKALGVRRYRLRLSY